MNRKFSLMLLTLALAGSLCACSNTTSEATPTPDSSPMATPENRSGIVGYGYNGYNNTDGGMWNADNGTTWDAADAARDAANGMENATRGAVNDIGNAARSAANDVRRGINDMARGVERSTDSIW
ncbi:MAG: hypothetical protein K2F83_04065 [Oscillospiraceae bacterium]|nr:hypothetical protein [Oscillospiraceae bacterium]